MKEYPKMTEGIFAIFGVEALLSRGGIYVVQVLSQKLV
jgi:hypothetical protein